MDYPALLHGISALFKDAARKRDLDQQQLEAARLLASKGQDAESVSAYRTFLATARTHAEAWHELALLLRRTGDPEHAQLSLIESIRADPGRIRAHHDFGLLRAHAPGVAELDRAYLSAMGGDLAEYAAPPSDEPLPLESVARAYGERVAREPASQASLRLACLQAATLRMNSAIETLQAAERAGLTQRALFEALGVLSELTGQDRQALAYQGHAAYFGEEFASAVACYTEALRGGSCAASVHARLARSHSALGDFSAAIAACSHGITCHPDDEFLHCLWAELLHEDGQTEACISVATAASARFPYNFALKRMALLSLPVVYDSPPEVIRYRQAYADGLTALLDQSRETSAVDPSRASSGIGSSFFLAYQGGDDRDLQVRLGGLIHRVMGRAYPQWSRPVPLRPLGPGERVRVGYASAHFHGHTVAKLFLGWLQAHDRRHVEVYAYHLGRKVDVMTHQVAHAADCFRHVQGPLEAIAAQVTDDRLHVLVYLDIGMDDLTTQLSALNLAPVQCAAWGHPVTTGLPTVGHFISSELAEPAGADRHYSETLVRLPGIGINVPPPHVDGVSPNRAALGLSAGDCVYLSPQSLFKYLPQYDDLFPRIAERVPHARFVFIQAASEGVTTQLKRRFLEAFSRRGLDGNAFLVFVPRQGHQGYLRLNQAADVFLDQPGWSGGMTTLEALGCGLPVVTWPGEFMRARHAAAFLRQLGLEQTIASSEDDLVDLAARLGTDAAWRQEVRQEIAARRHQLFNDVSCVTALERFYSSVVSAPPAE